MSKVTNLIITASVGENVDYIVQSMRAFKVKGNEFNIVSIDNEHLPKAWYGGSKYVEATILIGAYNYLDLDGLIDFMRTQVKWADPEDVQLIVKEEGDFKFRIIDLFIEQ